jgi:hypothetical protein
VSKLAGLESHESLFAIGDDHPPTFRKFGSHINDKIKT